MKGFARIIISFLRANIVMCFINWNIEIWGWSIQDRAELCLITVAFIVLSVLVDKEKELNEKDK